MSLKDINEKLAAAARILDEAAGEFHRSDLQPTKTYTREIGEALSRIFAVQRAIYELQPELKPKFLSERSSFPPEESRRFGEALITSSDLLEKGSTAQAAETWRKYLESNPHELFREMTETQLRELLEEQ